MQFQKEELPYGYTNLSPSFTKDVFFSRAFA